MNRTHGILILTTAFAVALAGCGGGTSGSSPVQIPSTSNSQGPLSIQQQSDIVSSTYNAIGDAVETGLGGSALSADRSAQTLNPCITATPFPIVDANHNGIPDNETYTFTNCTNLGWAAGETVNGQMNILDTSSGSTLSYTQTDTNLSSAGTDNGVSYTEVLNGQRFPSLVNNVESVTRAMQVVRTTASGTANVGQNWQWSFTPASGQTIQLLHPLPAGQFTSASGTITYANGTENATLTFSIAAPLTFDPTCATAPRLTSGVVSYTLTGSKTGTFTATFTGCGIPPIIAHT